MDKKVNYEYIKKDNFLSVELQRDTILGTISSRLLVLFVIAMAITLMFVMMFQLCEVIGTSMQPTLENSDHVLLSKIVREPKIGDVVVIEKTERNSTINIIKRVVAIEGDTLEFRQEGGKIELYRAAANTTELIKVEENYIKEPMKNFGGAFQPGVKFTIPTGCIFALGDNRNNSQDSRALARGEYFTTDDMLGIVAYTVEKGSFFEKFVLFLFHAQPTQNSLFAASAF